jgi:tetratricopeptide (TPR) repeat protein
MIPNTPSLRCNFLYHGNDEKMIRTITTGYLISLLENLKPGGRLEEANQILSNIIRLNPTEAGFWADYAENLSMLGKADEAQHAFERSINLDPSMEGVHEDFAELLRKSGDLSRAASEYRAALSVYEAQYKKGDAILTIP